MSSLAFIDIVLRAAAAGMLAVMALALARAWRTETAARLGTVFVGGTGIYALISSPHFGWQPGPATVAMFFIATLNSVFFWWFATALFDDGFRWRWWRMAPALVLTALFLIRLGRGADQEPVLAVALHQILVLAMMSHVLWLALRHRDDDLVAPRRRFRLIFALVVGATGVIIAGVEFALGGAPAPAWLVAFHGASIAALTLGFSAVTLRPVAMFAPAHEPRANGLPATRAVSEPLNAADLKRLEAAMAGGIWRQEGVSVGALAATLGLPEHRLRKLINQELGFRNFAAFLGERRIAEAKTLLADPDKARRQILQIALEVGYGSIGPFNRAFKDATGLTPTQFRRAALGETLAETENPSPNP